MDVLCDDRKTKTNRNKRYRHGTFPSTVNAILLRGNLHERYDKSWSFGTKQCTIIPCVSG